MLNKSPSANLSIATVRSGNVIGGGDWSPNRIIPDAIKSLCNSTPIVLRNPSSIRPWLYVLDPLYGYLRLAEYLFTSDSSFCSPFNFAPSSNLTKTVRELIEELLKSWSGSYVVEPTSNLFHETTRLTLIGDKASSLLGWNPTMDFEQTVSSTVSWYKDVLHGASPYERSMSEIDRFLLNQFLMSINPVDLKSRILKVREYSLIEHSQFRPSYILSFLTGVQTKVCPYGRVFIVMRSKQLLRVFSIWLTLVTRGHHFRMNFHLFSVFLEPY